ncbi:MAG TPA: MATE family efflux transporter, partial [Bryobacteraceae bacterium]|nr:MATE family efflux transporter [Bryobacteraceae bacterium]
MLRLAAPLVLAEIGWVMMGIVDAMMVGRVSQAAMGAVAIGSGLFYAIAMFGGGLLMGLDTLVSQAFGARRVDECHRSMMSGLHLCVPLTPLLMGAVWLAAPLLRRIGVQSDVLADARPYIHAVAWSTLPLLLYFVFRRYLQAMHVVRPVTFALVSANLVNLAGNWILVFGHFGAPAMGAEGSGWATCISRIYLAAVLAWSVWDYDRRDQTGLLDTSLQPDFPRIRRLLALGLPAALQFALEFGAFATATVLIGKLSTVTLAAHQIALNTASFTYMVPLGISAAAAVRVGNALGRGDVPEAGHAGWSAMVLGAGFMGCAGLFLLLAPGVIARTFTNDRAVIAASASLLFAAAVFQLFDGLQTVATGALRGAGETRLPMV